MKKRILALFLMLAMVFPTTLSFANETVTPGDGGYAEGMYLAPVSAFLSTKGMQENPYGDSKNGDISEEEMDEMLKDEDIHSKVEVFNNLYQSLIKFYKYGYERLDRWQEVKSMDEAVFGSINKDTWVKSYEQAATLLQKMRLYFDSIGLEESKYTYEETKEMIDLEELKFKEIEITPP